MFNNLISLISITLFIFIPLCIAILYLAKPNWVYKVTDEDQKVFAWDIIISMSVSISLVISIISIIFFASKRPPPDAPNYFQ